MEKTKNGRICPLTGWEIKSDVIEDNGYRYDIKCGNYSFTLWVTEDCWNSQTIKDLKHIVRWLLFNGKIRTINSLEDKLRLSFVLSEEKILDIIAESFIPQTPKEKSEHLLISLNKVFPTFKGEIAENDLFN